MINVGRSIQQRKVEYVDADGVTQSISIRPLKAKYLNDLLFVTGKLSKIKTTGSDSVDNDKAMELLSQPEISKSLVALCEATMKISYPTMSDEDIQDFVGAYFFLLFPEVLELNLGMVGNPKQHG